MCNKFVSWKAQKTWVQKFVTVLRKKAIALSQEMIFFIIHIYMGTVLNPFF